MSQFPNTWDVGDAVRQTVEFRNEDGNLFDPDVVRFALLRPGSAPEEYLYGTDNEVERVDVGRYRLTITAANAGRHSYRAWCTGEYAGAAERYFDVRPSAVLAAEGSGGEDDTAYCDDDDLDVIFGKTNVDRWADLDNDVDTTRIARRRLWARNLASATLDDRLRAGPYKLPFSDPVPAIVVDLSARLAGLLLYDSRGSQDVDSEQQPVNRMSGHRKYVDKMITGILAGTVAPGRRPSVAVYPQAFYLED